MGGFTTFINSAIIVAVIWFIVFGFWGVGGGFLTMAKIGNAMAQIPGIVYVVIGVIYLFASLRK